MIFPGIYHDSLGGISIGGSMGWRKGAHSNSESMIDGVGARMSTKSVAEFDRGRKTGPQTRGSLANQERR
jgi:hypothetical protein